MNLHKIASTLTVLTLLSSPALAFANTYQYIDTNGDLQSIQAANASQAMATAPNLAVHSGVVLGIIGGTGGSSEPVDNGFSGSYYQYIDTNGNLQSTDAASASSALLNTPDIAPHSGVILVTNNTKL